MIDKRVHSSLQAVAGIQDGATILVSGFGDAGVPGALLEALLQQGAGDLTLVSNSAGTGMQGIAGLLAADRVRKIVCCYPRREGSVIFEKLYAAGRIEVELVPQGTLCERIRAAAAGLGGFYTPTGADTELALNKEVRSFDGKRFVLERPLKADFAFIKATAADRWGNLVYHATARNYGPVMAGAAATTVAQVDEVVPLGALDPEAVVTPGILVQRVYCA